MTNPAMGWLVLRRLAGKRRRSSLSSGNGALLAFKRRRLRQFVRTDLISGENVGRTASSEAANGKCRTYRVEFSSLLHFYTWCK